MDHSGERWGEDAGEGRWLTYEELGRIRGIGRESAVKLVQRKRWRRMPGNDGVARALVPTDWLTPAKELSGEASPEHSGEPSRRHSGEPSPELASVVSGFEAALASLKSSTTPSGPRSRRRSTDRERTRAAAAEARADRLDQAVAAERSRADQWQGRAAKAEETAQAWARADAARKAKPLLSRLRDAWRAD